MGGGGAVNAKQARDFCAKHQTHPRSMILLAQFAESEDGQKLAEGKPLAPQFGAPKKTQAWTRSASRDWVE